MAIMALLASILYLWNAPQAIDYPLWDEATYFSRGYALLHGNLAVADLGNLGSSPLYVAYYALWESVLKTSLVFPFIMITSVILMTLGAYLMLSRIFHPFLSWVLAVGILIAATPAVPNNAVYYFGSGLLWLSLSLLNSNVHMRGLSCFGVLLSALVRPEFAAVFLVLFASLCIYEWRRTRREGTPWRILATAYAPALFGLLFLVSVVVTSTVTGYNRVSDAIPWSYTDWYLRTNQPGAQGQYTYANDWAIFQKDFGPVPSRSLMAVLLAMPRNPARLLEYLEFEGHMLVAGVGAGVFQGPGWHYNEYQSGITPAITAFSTAWIVNSLAIFALVSLAAYLLVRRRIHMASAIRRNAPALLGFLSLATVVVWLLLVQSYHRSYMIYPDLALGVGSGIACILALIRLPRILNAVAFVGLVIALPHPFLAAPLHPTATALQFLHAHVPSGSTLTAIASNSYPDYLQANGFSVNAVEASDYASPLLVNAFETNPDLEYAFISGSDGPSQFAQWSASWNATFPTIPWSLAAKQSNPPLYLYSLPPNSGARLTYWQLLQQVQVQHTGTQLPAFTAVDFATTLSWEGDDARNTVTPRYVPAWGILANAIVMYPNIRGAWVTRAHTVTATLPGSWAGKTLVFAGAFAPWEVNEPGADGTQLDVTVPGTPYHQVVQLPNSPDHQWQPFLVHLPQYVGSEQLQITVRPRYSLLWDDTLLTFVGLANSAPAAGTPQQKTG
jgi:hypothetical protein